jgi:hypothetical protein
MNKRSLGALVALNLVLLGGLLLTSLAQSAIYIIELGSGRMVALLYNSVNEQVELIDRRNLAEDAANAPAPGR